MSTRSNDEQFVWIESVLEDLVSFGSAHGLSAFVWQIDNAKDLLKRDITALATPAATGFLTDESHSAFINNVVKLFKTD